MVYVAPNVRALAQGWVSKEYGPFATFEDARRKQRFMVGAIDAWNECSGVARLERKRHD
jgi:hypothetical protein